MTSPHGKDVGEQHYYSILPFIQTSGVRQSVHHLLLNNWAGFNQTCYMTSPHGKGVQEQHYFSVWHPSVQHPSILLTHYLKPLGEIKQTCCMTSFHSKGVQE